MTHSVGQLVKSCLRRKPCFAAFEHKTLHGNDYVVKKIQIVTKKSVNIEKYK